jgi:hypothetical protein
VLRRQTSGAIPLFELLQSHRPPLRALRPGQIRTASTRTPVRINKGNTRELRNWRSDQKEVPEGGLEPPRDKVPADFESEQ